LAAENDALERLDLGRAAAMLATKEAALAAIAGAPPPAPCRLATLGDLARDNQRLLERAIATQARVLALVAEAARAALAGGAGPPCYGTAPRQGPPLALLRTA
ncbi:MAG: hypothetical protein KGK10_05290, partial [Rhodospirillales bacterium]|nr:hypothetical protein [Rhodospirillales bacterium]